MVVGPHDRLMAERAAWAVWKPWARAKITQMAEWVPSLRAFVIP